MKPTTIDNLDIKTHERYAMDQEIYDKTLSTETTLLSQHLDIVGTTVIYASKWADLFEMTANNQPWAAFAPPFTQRQPNRFFSSRILPSIHLEEPMDDEEGDEEGKEGEQKEKEEHELVKRAMQVQKGKNQDSFLFERDKTSILALLQTVTQLNSLLSQINARKLQYQKG